MKKLITAALAAAAVTPVIAPAAAQASSQHWCRQGDPPIVASSSTSCAFAGNMVNKWAARGDGVWRVYSPVTHRTYRIEFSDHASGYVLARGCVGRWCDGPSNIWAAFSDDL